MTTSGRLCAIADATVGGLAGAGTAWSHGDLWAGLQQFDPRDEHVLGSGFQGRWIVRPLRRAAMQMVGVVRNL